MKISQSARPRISRDGLLVLTEPAGEGLACHLGGCNNPECDCRELTIRAVPFDSRVREVTIENGALSFRAVVDGGPNRAVDDFMELRIDVDHGGLYDADGSPVDVASQPRLAILEQAVDAGLLDQMARFWFRCKGWKVDEGARRSDIDLTRWTPGDTLFWDEVHQALRQDVYLLGDVTYAAADMYCVNPECPCRRVSVGFGGPKTDVGAVHVELDSGKAELDPTPGKGKLLRVLWERYLSRHHGTGHLRRREKQMKEFGAEMLYAPRPEMVRRERAKVGRNDPCPCGSGKKYKKCCLGKPLSAVV